MVGSFGMGGHLGLAFGCVGVKDCLFGGGAWRRAGVAVLHQDEPYLDVSLLLGATFGRFHKMCPPLLKYSSMVSMNSFVSSIRDCAFSPLTDPGAP